MPVIELSAGIHRARRHRSADRALPTSADAKFVVNGDVRLWAEGFGDRLDPAVLLIMGTSSPSISWPDELVDTLGVRNEWVTTDR